ncbi:DUF6817 domain-containing protein [Streptomyces sp. NPDC000410]|uniref:DUF6817 domain-containing protein n=1 Tax=Streptomyces sp. NPDC000410 TaxID=3154254 RepID=UPI00331D9B34
MAGRAAELLRACGAAGLEHPGGTLLAHLERVRERLAWWGARPELQLAGLCHAFYGTDGFSTSLLPLERRGELAAAIGEEAEALVYFYASCDRELSYATLAQDDAVFRDRFTGETFTPTLRQRQEFAELTAANELDLAEVNDAFRTEWGGRLLMLFARFAPLLSESARKDLRTGLDPGIEARTAFLQGLEPGEVRRGVVSGTESFGVFVELGGGKDGFINCAELTWSSEYFAHTSELLSVGQEVTATVLEINWTRVEAELSLKDLEPDPMREFARSQLGRIVPGVVITKRAPIGTFVRMRDGMVGLVPVADLAEREPQVGDEVSVEVVGVNINRRQITLALR